VSAFTGDRDRSRVQAPRLSVHREVHRCDTRGRVSGGEGYQLSTLHPCCGGVAVGLRESAVEPHVETPDARGVAQVVSRLVPDRRGSLGADVDTVAAGVGGHWFGTVRAVHDGPHAAAQIDRGEGGIEWPAHPSGRSGCRDARCRTVDAHIRGAGDLFVAHTVDCAIGDRGGSFFADSERLGVHELGLAVDGVADHRCNNAVVGGGDRDGFRSGPPHAIRRGDRHRRLVVADHVADELKGVGVDVRPGRQWVLCARPFDAEGVQVISKTRSAEHALLIRGNG